MLAEWATRAGLNRERVEALVLSGYEASVNVVEHAYDDEMGELALHANYYRSDPFRP